MTVAWVLGSGGMLGAALCRQLRGAGTHLFAPAERFSWSAGEALSAQIEAAVQAFAERASTADRWEIYWAAGVGTMGSSVADLAPETRALSLLLQFLAGEPRLMAASGTVALASTAGAIYAGATDEVITEDTVPAPTTDYARAKLSQEALLRGFAEGHARVAVLMARISTLYGGGQAAGKKQGLMSHLARSILRNQAVQIYVPYDTIRDYITADDAAAAMVAASRRGGGDARVLVKIVASERPATIAEIVSIFRRLARRAPRIATRASPLAGLYARRVQFRSIVLISRPRVPPTTLAVGIAQLMAAERLALMRGAAWMQAELQHRQIPRLK